MTQEQKEKLSFQVVLHQPRNVGGEDTYFMNNGEIVQFTDCTNYSENSEYIINNNQHKKIWYSQLAYIFFNDNLDLVATTIKFLNGEEISFFSLDSVDLYNRCKGKHFKVKVLYEYKYTFNKKSKRVDEIGLYTYQEIYNYITSCIADDRFNDIGDLLKTATAYSLQEV